MGVEFWHLPLKWLVTLTTTLCGMLCYRTACDSSKTAEDTNFKFGRRVPRDSPDMTPDKSFRCGRGQGHVTPVNVWALNANSSKTAEGTNFKFDRHVPGVVATWPLTKVSETLAWPESRDHDNSTMQTAAMGLIPRSKERILVSSSSCCIGQFSYICKSYL